MPGALDSAGFCHDGELWTYRCVCVRALHAKYNLSRAAQPAVRFGRIPVRNYHGDKARANGRNYTTAYLCWRAPSGILVPACCFCHFFLFSLQLTMNGAFPKKKRKLRKQLNIGAIVEETNNSIFLHKQVILEVIICKKL
jgi:hypothetical protein